MGKQPNRPRTHPEEGADVVSGQYILRLQRGVLKLALSFRGQNPRLDELLKRLGILMKGGRRDGDIQVLIDDIVEVIVSNDVAQDPRQAAAKALRELLDHLATKPAWRDETRALQRRLEDLESADELGRYLKEAAELINAQLRIGRNGEEPDAKLRPAEDNLARFLDRLEVPPELHLDLARIRTRLEHQNSQAALLESIEAAAQLISGALSARMVTPDAPSPTARDLLVELLDQLAMPGAFAEEMAAIKASLIAGTDHTAVGHAVTATASLVAKARALMAQELGELRQLLRTVLGRLTEFKGQMAEAGLVHADALQSTAEFERLMVSQVEDMRDAVVDGEDLETVKQHMHSHLETIGAGLRDFAQREKRRHTGAKSQLGAVVEKLNALEEETRSLRESLAEQRCRSLMDSLTGVLNRIGYDEAMDREYSRWQRHGGALCVAVIDVDYFKSVNDKYGHTAGDKVLATVATLVKRSIRQSDILCRYGGEEFALILPETELDGGIAAMEKIRQVVADSNFRFRETRVPVTISIGIAEFHVGDEISDGFDRADRAMYHAKELGRNRCCSQRDFLCGAASEKSPAESSRD